MSASLYPLFIAGSTVYSIFWSKIGLLYFYSINSIILRKSSPTPLPVLAETSKCQMPALCHLSGASSLPWNLGSQRKVPGFKVNFVAHYDNEGALLNVVAVHLQPLPHILMGLLIAHIVEYDGALGVPQVAGDQTLESLLACSVPELQPELPAVVVDVGDHEIDAHCRLRYGQCVLPRTIRISHLRTVKSGRSSPPPDCPAGSACTLSAF